MTVYGFKAKQDVLDLKEKLRFERNRPDMVDQGGFAGGQPRPSQIVFPVRAPGGEGGPAGKYLKTPTGGIPAATMGVEGPIPGFQNGCVEYTFDESAGEYKPGDPIDCYNGFFQAIGGNTFITAKECGGLLLADAEDCPAPVGPTNPG